MEKAHNPLKLGPDRLLDPDPPVENHWYEAQAVSVNFLC